MRPDALFADPRPLEEIPGAMAVVVDRQLRGGTVTFEQAPVGFLTQKSMPRKEEWRRYYWTPAGATKRVVVPSVTTVCGSVIPKDGLPPWAEAEGIKGAIEAVRRGLILRHTTPAEAVRIVRDADLGQEAAKDRAAGRGINVHRILEGYLASGGRIPNPAEHPEHHRPFIQGLARWLMAARPEPEAVEMIVCDPERGYAGRLDLIAKLARRRTLVDLKTQEDGKIYDSAHLQVQLLKQAEERFGDITGIERLLLVAVDGHGNYREMECIAPPTIAEHALNFYKEIKPIVTQTDQINRDIAIAAREKREA